MEKKVINQFYHEHPLIFIENVSDEVSPNCYGCGDPVTNLESAYVCTQQKTCQNRIILHKKCGELPIQVLHPKHPQHPLHLKDYHGKRDPGWCNVCLRDLKPVLKYRCSSCNFDVDIKCEKISIDMVLEENRQIEHPSHPDHPLTLMRKPSFLFSCDGCGVEDVDMAYICSICEVWIHKSCASLPVILPLNRQYHHHPLSLAFTFPLKYHKYISNCDVCLKRLNTTCWVYFCGICRFFAHIRCVVASTTGDSNLRDDEDEDGSNVIEFPLHAHDISKELITPFVMREKGLSNIPDLTDMPATVKMPETTASFSFLFNYHKHPLSLVSELYSKDDEVDHNNMMDERDDDDEYDELKVCDVCVTPIFSPPYYECAPCKYFVHSICYLLRKTLSSSSPPPVLYGDCPKTHDKNHKLTLYTSSLSIDMDPRLCRCEACCCVTNGMVYVCEGCEMKIDVKCASLPTTIRHASHPHRTPLVLTRIPPAGEEEAGKPRRCHACRYDMDNCIAYCCSSNDCDFALDLGCAMLPASITMREWDKHHSLMLSFDASFDHPSDFVCDFCETEMHPKRWMYHCRQCDLSFHLFCLSGRYQNIKFGRRFVLDGIHPNHPLTFNHITIKRRCNLCDEDVYNYCGLECASCYYVVCLVCATEELSEMMELAT